MPRTSALPTLVLVVLFGLASCGSRDASPPAGSATANPRAGTIVRSAGSDIDSLDPALATLTESGDIIRDAYEGLTVLDAAAQAVPGIAAQWDLSADGLTYTFRLRRDAAWSNGEPVTAGDFVNSWRRIVTPATASPWGSLLSQVTNADEILAGKNAPESLGVTAPDTNTLIVSLRAPVAYFPELAAHWALVPTYGGKAPAKPGATTSNGAYVIKEQVPNSHVLLDKNERYYNAGSVAIARVRYVQITESTDEYNRFRAGDLDVTSSAPLRPIDELRAEVGERLRVAPFLALYYYGFNTAKPPFDSKALRQALSMTVDRERLTYTMLRLGNPPAYTLVPDGLPGYSPQKPEWAAWSYDERVKRAKELYASAGYSSAKPLRTTLRYNVGSGHERIALAVTSMWKESLGAEVTPIAEEFKSLLQTIQRGDAPLFRSSWVADFPDASTFLLNYTRGNPMNFSFYEQQSFQKALADTTTETDPARRIEQLQTAERVFSDDAAIVPLYFMITRRLVQPRVVGWSDNPMRVTYSRTLSIAG